MTADVRAGVRSALAFVVPAVLGNLLLALGSLIDRRRARNANAWLIGRLGP